MPTIIAIANIIGTKSLSLGSLQTITDVTITPSDVEATIAATINPGKSSAIAAIEYGLTTSYGEIATFPQSPITANTITQVGMTISGLLPYKRYFYRITVLNHKGTAYYEGNFITLEPFELTDGNWVAMYDATYNKHVMHATNTTQIVELRDKQYDCALGDDLFNNTTFDNSTGWTLTADMTISGGNMNFNNAAVARSAYAAIVGTNDINPVHVEATGVVITAGSARARVSYGLNYIAGIATTALPAGDSSFDMCYTNNIAYVYVLNMSPYPTTWSIGGLRIRKIRGKHLINPDTVRPTKGLTDDFITFTSTQRIIGYTIPALGTVYAKVKRTGIDSDFVLRTDLTNIGEYSAAADTFTLGANAALSTYYPQQLKFLNIRSVVDSESTKQKLEEWFSRTSYEIPPLGGLGVTGTGIWNDDAFEADDIIYNDGQ